MLFEYYCNGKYESSTIVQPKDQPKLIEKAHAFAMREIVKTEKDHVLYAITIYDENDSIKKQMIFRNTCLTDIELDDYIIKFPKAIFGVIHSGAKLACKKILVERKNRQIKPITLKQANSYVKQYHRHLGGTIGCK